MEKNAVLDILNKVPKYLTQLKNKLFLLIFVYAIMRMIYKHESK